MYISPRRADQALALTAGGWAALPLEELVAKGMVEYIPFPPALEGKYQSFTQADIDKLRAAGYREKFASVEEGVARYVERMLRVDTSLKAPQ